MSKPNNNPPRKKPKPFYKDNRLTLMAVEQGDMITEWKCIFDGKEYSFKVKKFNILQAFKKLEKLTCKLK